MNTTCIEIKRKKTKRKLNMKAPNDVFIHFDASDALCHRFLYIILSKQLFQSHFFADKTKGNGKSDLFCMNLFPATFIHRSCLVFLYFCIYFFLFCLWVPWDVCMQIMLLLLYIIQLPRSKTAHTNITNGKN